MPGSRPSRRDPLSGARPAGFWGDRVADELVRQLGSTQCRVGCTGKCVRACGRGNEVLAGVPSLPFLAPLLRARPRQERTEGFREIQRSAGCIPGVALDPRMKPVVLGSLNLDALEGARLEIGMGE